MPDEEPPLKRETAGRYRTRDARFAVEQNSGRWLVLDTEQTDELGLPLVRGPYSTLDDARAAILTARSGPTPTSPLGKRAKAAPSGRARSQDVAVELTRASSKADRAPTAAVEYSPQSMGGNVANHIHGIYRDPTNDYGKKLIETR